MKTLLRALGLILGVSMPILAAPSSPPAGNFILNVSTTLGQPAFNVSSGTILSTFYLPFLTIGQCVTVNAGKQVVGVACGSSGASSLAVTTGSISGFSSVLSSPTAVINFDSSTFNLALAGAATVYVLPNPSSVTLQGNNLSATYMTNSSATATYLQLSSATAAYLTVSSAAATYFNLNNILSIARGGTGTSSPGLIAGTNITSITGSWPNQTINAAAQGGGGASLLGVNQNAVSITTPTAAFNFIGPPFIVTSVGGGTTAQLSLNPSSVTLQGQNVINLTSALQPGATFYISSGTVQGPLTVTNLTATAGVNVQGNGGSLQLSSLGKGAVLNVCLNDGTVCQSLTNGSAFYYDATVGHGYLGIGPNTPTAPLHIGELGSGPYVAIFSTSSTVNQVAISTNAEIVVSGSTGTSGQFLSSQGPGLPVKWATAVGGGGASTLETLAGVNRTSPTVTIGYPATQFVGTVTGSSMTVTLNPSSVTLQGNTNVALLNSSQTFTGRAVFVSSVTVSTLNATGMAIIPPSNQLFGQPTLNQWFAQMADLQTFPTTPSKKLSILIIGDSHINKNTVTGPFTTWLYSNFGNAGTYDPLSDFSEIDNTYRPYGCTYSKTGTWITDGLQGLGLDVGGTSTTVVGSNILTSCPGGDSVIFHYKKMPNGGSVAITIDNGSTFTLATSSAGVDIASFTISGLGYGVHTASITYSVSGTAGIDVLDLVFFAQSQPGAVIYRAGAGAATAQQYAQVNAAQYQKMLTMLPSTPSVIVAEFGVNESGSNMAPSQMITYMRTAMTNYRAVFPQIDCAYMSSPDYLNSASQTFPMSAYEKAWQQAALEDNCAFIDFTTLFSSEPFFNSYYADGIHLNNNGGLVGGQILVAMFANAQYNTTPFTINIASSVVTMGTGQSTNTLNNVVGLGVGAIVSSGVVNSGYIGNNLTLASNNTFLIGGATGSGFEQNLKVATMTALAGNFTNGVTVGSATVNGPGNGVITMTISGTTSYIATSSSDTAIIAGHLAKWSTTNYTLVDGGVSSGGGTPAGNAYDVQVASPNLTQMAGYDNFQNNGTTVSITSADTGALTNYSSMTWSGYTLFALAGTTVTLDSASPFTTASSMTVNSTSGLGLTAGPLTLGSQAAPVFANGQVWQDSTQQSIRTSVAGTTQSVNGNLWTMTVSSSVFNATTETTVISTVTTTGVGTLNLPANFFVAGKTIYLVLMGTYTTTGTPTIDIKVKLGGTTILDSGVVTLTAVTGTDVFTLSVHLTCRTTGSSGSVMAVGQTVQNTSTIATAGMDLNSTLTTLNTTIAQPLSVTVTWGAASASNNLTFTNGFVNVVN